MRWAGVEFGVLDGKERGTIRTNSGGVNNVEPIC